MLLKRITKEDTTFLAMDLDCMISKADIRLFNKPTLVIDFIAITYILGFPMYKETI